MLFPTPTTRCKVWWLSSFCFLLFQVNKMEKIDKTSGHEQALKDGSNTCDTSPQNSPRLLYIQLKGSLDLRIQGIVCLVNPSTFLIHILAHSHLDLSHVRNTLQQEVYSSATHCMRTHLHWFAWSPHPANLICWPLVLVLDQTLDSHSLATLSLAHRISQTSRMCHLISRATFCFHLSPLSQHSTGF